MFIWEQILFLKSNSILEGFIVLGSSGEVAKVVSHALTLLHSEWPIHFAFWQNTVFWPF